MFLFLVFGASNKPRGYVLASNADVAERMAQQAWKLRKVRLAECEQEIGWRENIARAGYTLIEA